MSLSEDQIHFLEIMFPAALQFLGTNHDLHFESEEVLAGRAAKLAGAFLAERDRLITMINGMNVGVTVTQSSERVVNHGNGGNGGNSRFSHKLFEKIMSVPECPICQNDKRGAPGTETCSHLHFPPFGTLKAPDQP